MRNIRAMMLWFVLLLAVVGVIWFAWLRRPDEGMPGKSLPSVPTNAASSISSVTGTTPKKSVVVIQTGQERMSNAIRCMSYVADLSNQLPKERGSDKPILMSLAGVLFFDDCLMAKMSNGLILTTTNELRQSFSNAVSQVFPAGVPSKLLEGFEYSFTDRNNLRITLNEQYHQMAQYPELTRTLNTLNSALQQAGITDATQSDLKELCLKLCSIRTTAYLMYGPQAAGTQSEIEKEVAALEYQAMADSLDKVLRWRLVNMYGLDDVTAQAVVQAVSGVPVKGFSHAALQPPAFIQ